MLDQIFYNAFKCLAVSYLFIGSLLPVLQHLVCCSLHGF